MVVFPPSAPPAPNQLIPLPSKHSPLGVSLSLTRLGCYNQMLRYFSSFLSFNVFWAILFCLFCFIMFSAQITFCLSFFSVHQLVSLPPDHHELFYLRFGFYYCLLCPVYHLSLQDALRTSSQLASMYLSS